MSTPSSYIPKVRKALVAKVVGVLVVLGIVGAVVSDGVFYAEPGYIYHVRTVMGDEEVERGRL